MIYSDDANWLLKYPIGEPVTKGILFFKKIIIAVSIVLTCAVRMNAQSISLGVSTIYDENIFNTYTPLLNRLAQFQLDASKGVGFRKNVT